MNKEENNTKVKSNKIDLKELRKFLTFRNIIFILLGFLLFLIILQQLIYRPSQIPSPQTTEERLTSIEKSILNQINKSEKTLIVIDDSRILTFDEFNRLIDQIETDKKIVPSGRLLKEWLQTDNSTPFNNENSEFIRDEEDGGIENPYEGLSN